MATLKNAREVCLSFFVEFLTRLCPVGDYQLSGNLRAWFLYTRVALREVSEITSHFSAMYMLESDGTHRLR